MMMKGQRIRIAVAVLITTIAASACASSGGLAEVVGEARRQAQGVLDRARLPDVNALLGTGEPVTTNFNDATTEEPALDAFNPPPTRFLPMTGMLRGENGVYRLTPGLYSLDARGYCIKAGTYGPSTGDGYLYAPLAGPRADVVRNLLIRSATRSDIRQQDVQVLLWALIARTRLSDMPESMQRTARELLSPGERFELDGGALALIPDDVLHSALGDLPQSIQRVYRAEQEIRRQLTNEINAPYERLERLAVLAGAAPAADLVRPVPLGRWSRHPDGYYVRYLPAGYQRMRYEVMVPEPGSERFPAASRAAAVLSASARPVASENAQAATSVVFDPTRNVAVPANTSAQRLVSGGDPVGGVCGDPGTVAEFDATDRDTYHSYEEETMICRTGQPGCTPARVYNTMVSQMRFMAPTLSRESLQQCKRSELGRITSLHPLRIVYDNVVNSNTIRTTYDNGGLSITNYTVQGHQFHPGAIRRTVLVRNGEVIVRTFGEGNGPQGWLNENVFNNIWMPIDYQLRQAVTESLGSR